MEDLRESFNELIDTPLDFSAFVMNRLKVDTLTPELLAGSIFKMMKGSCKSLVELEYFFEEVYKATTNQLDWNNSEGQQYPHDLRKPLPLIPNSRVTKTKAADYGNIKWIEDLVPNTMWSHVPVSYDTHALWGISHWGRKQQQFYGFVANRESARDVYSKHDDKLYKFKEGDFNRLRIQDIEDMLLLLVQGKLTNLTVEERLAFNVSLRIFTRSIDIQRRVEDLQLGVESYLKKLKLIKPDTYRSYLKQREAYTAYSNPRGFIYQNKDKKNRLMRIDELHKFSDGTLNDVRTALDDRLKGIQMKYLPQTIWRQSDRDKAGAMIQVVRHRYSNPMIQPEPKGSTHGYPLDSVEVLRPSDAMQTSKPLKVSQQTLVSLLTEKVSALEANGVMSGSRVGVVWMEVGGGIIRMGELSLEEMSMKIDRGSFPFRGIWVEELALEAMEYDNQMRKIICRFLVCEDDEQRSLDLY
ncbi:hypothetical protein Tco_0664567 [Tanacetum coccineum]